MDFIEKLPSSSGFDTILVIVDRLSKQAIFIPTHDTITSAERTVQTLEQYLRVYCNYQQNNWSELLPLAEFAYNNAPSATTGVSPFFANKRYHPNLSVYPERDIASSQACDFVIDLDELQSTLKEEIANAQRQYKPSADSHRQRPPDFQAGQSVFVKSQYFHTTRPSKKLSEKYLGPYEIIA